MKSIYKSEEIINRSINILLLVALLSVLMLLANFNGIAQADYQNYYYPQVPGISYALNFTQYNWQNYNFTPYSNYSSYQYMQPGQFNQILPIYGQNYLNYNYGGLSYYNYGMNDYNFYSNFGNSAYLNPYGYYTSVIPS